MPGRYRLRAGCGRSMGWKDEKRSVWGRLRDDSRGLRVLGYPVRI